MPQKQGNRVPADSEGEPELIVPRSQIDQELRGQIAQGQELLEQAIALKARSETKDGRPRSIGIAAHFADYETLRDKFYNWDEYNEQLLRSRFSTGKLANNYRLMTRRRPQEFANLQIKSSWLTQSINQRLDLYKSADMSATQADSENSQIGDNTFLVHGHDGDTKLQVAEFVERITGKRPVILHEQADSGRTIIEEFEEHASQAGFAIILLTADDVGKAKGANQLNPRARQNVVLECGYFMAKLGRGRVVVLYEAGVELPSDVTGVLYKSLDENWHTELARELKAADIEINFSKLFS